jgi:hypothetical protein
VKFDLLNLTFWSGGPRSFVGRRFYLFEWQLLADSVEKLLSLFLDSKEAVNSARRVLSCTVDFQWQSLSTEPAVPVRTGYPGE